MEYTQRSGCPYTEPLDWCQVIFNETLKLEKILLLWCTVVFSRTYILVYRFQEQPVIFNTRIHTRERERPGVQGVTQEKLGS